MLWRQIIRTSMNVWHTSLCVCARRRVISRHSCVIVLVDYAYACVNNCVRVCLCVYADGRKKESIYFAYIRRDA